MLEAGTHESQCIESEASISLIRLCNPLPMKRRSILLLILCGLAICRGPACWAEDATKDATVAARRFLTKFDPQIVDAHEQGYPNSCIPSSMEMVLKLLGRVPDSYFDLQKAWKNMGDGGFIDFHGKTFAGVTFRLQYALPSNGDFPLSALFDTIHHELEAGRFVIASLASPRGWHMWVIYDEDINGEFLAVSKDGRNTLKKSHVKADIVSMQGTHICTYEFPTSPVRLPSEPPRFGRSTLNR